MNRVKEVKMSKKGFATLYKPEAILIAWLIWLVIGRFFTRWVYAGESNHWVTGVWISSVLIFAIIGLILIRAHKFIDIWRLKRRFGSKPK